MSVALVVLVGYGLGCLPVATAWARRQGVDLRSTADGNPGAWNALEQLGGRRAWPVFLGDGLKGLLAGLAGWAIAGTVWGAYAGVGAAMLGHAFPLPARGRGGKSVMSWVGGMFAVAPLAAALALVVCVATSGARRSFAVGARAGVLAFVPLQLALDPVRHVAATGVLMCLIGLLFWLRRSGRATPASAAGHPGSPRA